MQVVGPHEMTAAQLTRVLPRLKDNVARHPWDCALRNRSVASAAGGAGQPRHTKTHKASGEFRLNTPGLGLRFARRPTPAPIPCTSRQTVWCGGASAPLSPPCCVCLRRTPCALASLCAVSLLVLRIWIWQTPPHCTGALLGLPSCART